MILLLKGKKMSIAVSSLALLLAASFFTLDKIIISEAPTYAKIAAYKAGYWFWLASMAMMVVTTVTWKLLRER